MILLIQYLDQLQRQMGRTTLSLLVLVFCLFVISRSQESLIVVTSKNISKPILDTDRLNQHIRNNQKSANYLVDTSSSQESVIKFVKSVLETVGVEKDNVNSFVLQTKQLQKSIEPMLSIVQQVSADELVNKLTENPEAVLYFSKKLSKSRLLEETTQQETGKSNLFLNMTPSVLSGLFVGLFLIVVLLIAVKCLFDLKTNDKFASNNLFVGKQS